MSQKKIKLNFENVNLNFEGITDKTRLEKISQNIFTLLNQKILKQNFSVGKNSINLENLSVGNILVMPTMNDEKIAEKVADELFKKISEKIH